MIIKKGSITVFLSFIFVIILSLITAVIENVRVITSEAYVAAASSSAVKMAFGNYNKELYENYRLFAYGGYDGIGIGDLEAEIADIVNKNLVCRPSGSDAPYSNLYRIGGINCEIDDYYMLDEDDVFIKQISEYASASAAKDIKDFIVDKVGGKKEVADFLDETMKYENGEYDTVPDEDSSEGAVKKNPDKPSDEELDEELEKDEAGGNPLKVIGNLINEGLLSLVCDVSKVSENEIEIDEYEEPASKSNTDKSSVAQFFKSLFNSEEGEGLNQDALLLQAQAEGSVDKLKYMFYAQKVFSSYIDEEYKTVHYGLEYLVAGKKTEKENLAGVVKRLLILRTLLNMAYLPTDPDLMSKSLATAETIAGFVGLAPVIEAIKWTILTILAFEEACVDVAALLDGKKVPLIKNASNFKIKYSEICKASPSFFKKKAKTYYDDGGKISADISYEQYLLLFELLVSKKKIKSRIIDIIQFDLRERYNQTFEFRECICCAKCNISYDIPYAYSYVTDGIFDKIDEKSDLRETTVSYGYAAGIFN